jgi:hypothetical protein
LHYPESCGLALDGISNRFTRKQKGAAGGGQGAEAWPQGYRAWSAWALNHEKRFEDIVLMALLREEWEDLRRE